MAEIDYSKKKSEKLLGYTNVYKKIADDKEKARLEQETLKLQVENQLETQEGLKRKQEIDVEVHRLIDTFDTLIDEVKTEEKAYIQALREDKERAVKGGRILYATSLTAEHTYTSNACIVHIKNHFEFPFTIQRLSFGKVKFKLPKPIVLPPKSETSIPLVRKDKPYVGNINIAGKYVVMPKGEND